MYRIAVSPGFSFDELVHPLGTVDVHDVPEDGLPPDLYHRLGHQMAFLADTRSESACQNDCLHLPLPKRITAMLQPDEYRLVYFMRSRHSGLK